MSKKPTYNPYDLNVLIYHAEKLLSAINLADGDGNMGYNFTTIKNEDWNAILIFKHTMSVCIDEIKEESER